ncbi:MAG: site-2 protease family protein [Actinomycetota bacterium]
MLGLLLNGRFEELLIVALVLVIALSLHEFGHAFAADLQGDPTPRNLGRLTVNPKAHLDPFGTLMIVLAGFGWGKPVPFNPARLRNQRFGSLIVGGAGPLMNIILAFLAAIALRLLSPGPDSSLFVLRLLFAFIEINVLLAVFNLIPVPPLDGSRILAAVLPPSQQRIVYFLDRWGFAILLVLFVFGQGLLTPLLGAGTDTVSGWILKAVGYGSLGQPAGWANLG